MLEETWVRVPKVRSAARPLLANTLAMAIIFNAEEGFIVLEVKVWM